MSPDKDLTILLLSKTLPSVSEFFCFFVFLVSVLIFIILLMLDLISSSFFYFLQSKVGSLIWEILFSLKYHLVLAILPSRLFPEAMSKI
jgi:uncharacterized integral membrane protein